MSAETRLHPSWFDRIFYFVASHLIYGISKVVFRMHVEGREYVPKSGAFIAAPVHRSNLDTPIAGSTIPRRVHFMGKAALWSTPFSAWLFSALGGFPVDREKNPGAAVRTAMRFAEAGESLALFPEGTRHSGDRVGELQDGAAFIAIRFGIPIVPIGVAGTEAILPPNAGFPKFKKVAIVYGKPIVPPAAGKARERRAAIAELNAELRTELQRLYDAAADRLR